MTTPSSSIARRPAPGLLPLLATIALVVPAAATIQHPNNERGLSADTAYEIGDVDHVNLLNGGLSITVPIGRAYPVGGSLSYALTLVYSSKVWDWETVCDPTAGQPSSFCQDQPTAGLDFNAGLGWMLHLGRMIPPNTPPRNDSGRWLYLAQDGSEHAFHMTLHDGEPVVAGTYYSRDSAYLRLRDLGDRRTVEFPDGTLHTFDADGWLERIEDRFGNALEVTRTSSRWTLSDGFRQHTIDFQSAMMDGESRPLVQQVRLAAFGGQTATYTFDYEEVHVERPCPFEPIETPPGIAEMPPTARVQMLRGVTLPDGSNYWMPPSNGGYYTTRDGPPAGICARSGSIRKVQLPTQGTIEWDYTLYPFPPGTALDHPVGTGPPDDFAWLVETPGVSRRTLSSAGATTGGTWTYTPSDTATQGAAVNGLKPVELRREVVSPAGDKTIHYFAAHQAVPPATDARRWQYGLPISLLRTMTQDNVTLYKSTDAFAGLGGTAQRSTWLAYAHDGGPFSNQLRGANRRVRFERTDHHPGHYASTRYSHFDGLGHHRTVITKGNMRGGQERRDVVTDYLLDGTPHPSAPWILDLFDRVTRSEGASVEDRTYCYEAATGFLQRVRLRRSAGADQGGDVIQVFTRDGRGQVTSERYHLAPGGGANLCTAATGVWDYRIDHTYASGTRATSRYLGMPFKSLDLEIDPRTGLPSARRDLSGIRTALRYDRMGRITDVQPESGHGAWVRFFYTPATSPTNPARARIVRRPNGGSGAVLSESELVFDGYGRVGQERERMPNGSWSLVETRYNAMGWRTARSEQERDGPGAPFHWTYFGSFDPFGRPRLITPPDGGQHSVTVSYQGVALTSRTVKVRTAGDAGAITLSSATTTERYDRYGRLWQVSEPSGGLIATYDYDVADRLVKATLAGSGTDQEREFDYDGRGFLLGERHPEKGASLNGGWVHYAGHDARGHATNKLDGGVTLVFDYDGAERLTRVLLPSGGRTIKAFTYGTANSGTDRRLGRLVSATRSNHGQAPWLPPGNEGTIWVTESYEYRAQDGRPSKRTVAVGPTTFEQHWAYDDLGNVRFLTYPRCTHADCTGSDPGPTRTQELKYAYGRLESVPGLVDFVGYHPNGTKAHLDHANDTLHYFVADPHGMARPRDVRLILASGEDVGFGDHLYDGAGNLIVRGPDYFLYDRLSRLTRYQYSGGAFQTYGYDAFGNLDRVTTFDGQSTQTRTLAMVTKKNRLDQAGYDARGNLTDWSNVVHVWDEVDMLFSRSRPSQANEKWETHIYTADDERVCTFHWRDDVLTETWTLRDLDNQVLTVYTKPDSLGAADWDWQRDYVHHPDGTLLLSITDLPDAEAYQHYATDHLGSPLITTDGDGGVLQTDALWGFGESFEQTGEPQRRLFTGHERDYGIDGEAFDLDYMHARHYSPFLARFLSVDRGQDWDLEIPQSWNLYPYVRNNPMNATDPTGLCTDPGGGGVRLCIATFIPTRSFGGFQGDDRGAQADGGTFRTQQLVHLSSDDRQIRAEFQPGMSVFGLARMPAVVAEQAAVANPEGGVSVSAKASDGLLFGAAPDLQYDLQIKPSKNGTFTVSGRHTKFPSLEVWLYEDGKEPVLIYVHNTDAEGVFEGLEGIRTLMEIPE